MSSQIQRGAKWPRPEPVPHHRPPFRQAGGVPGYPYGLALLNVLFIGFGLGAVLDSIDTELRHQLAGSVALLGVGGAHWYYTRRSGHPVWNMPEEWTGGALRGRTTTIAVAADVILTLGLWTIA